MSLFIRGLSSLSAHMDQDGIYVAVRKTGTGVMMT